MNSIMRVAAILCIVVLAGCGGGDEIGVEKAPNSITAGVEESPSYEWKVVLSKLILQQSPKGPTTGPLFQTDDGTYVALPSEIIVPSVRITRGSPVVTYVATSLVTGKTTVFPDNIGLPVRFKLAPGTYKFTAKIGEYETEPVALIVRCPAL